MRRNKLSRYKKKKLIGMLVSSLILGLGIVLLEYSAMPALGVPFMTMGSFALFYFVLYFFFEYEEDDASSTGLFNWNAGQVNSDDYRKIK